MPASRARRLVLLALVGGVTADILFDRVGLGINVPLMILAALAVSAAVRPADARFDRLDAWLPAVAVAAAVLVAIRSDPIVTFLDLALASIATLATIVALSGVAVTRGSLLAVTSVGVLAGAWLGIGSAALFTAAGADDGWRGAGAASRRSLPLVRGLLIAAPIVLVFTALLASADAVFAHVVDVTLALPIDVGDLAWRGAASVAAAWAVGGALAIATRAVPLELPDLGLESLVALGPNGARLRAATEATVVLVLVDVLFAVFVALQVAYLFGGADTVAAVGITYSDYAHQGYFQLVAVVVGAGLLLVIAAAAARRPEGRSPVFLGSAVALLGLTAVILASAAVRLGLYQQAYGWTELRFYVAASICWLAIAGVIATALLVRDRMGWLAHGLAIGAVIVTLGVSVIGPQSFITDQNLARALDPSLVPPGGHAGLDAEYLAGLGDDAIPAIVAALPHLDAASQLALEDAVDHRFQRLVIDHADQDWQAWNLSREHARAVLANR